MRVVRWTFYAFLAAASVGSFVRPLCAGIIAADDFESYFLGQLEPGSVSGPFRCSACGDRETSPREPARNRAGTACTAPTV